MITDSMLSLRAYAKRRGCNHMVIQRAVRDGRLTQSVHVDDGGRKWIADPDLADRELDANTDLTRAPAYVKVREAQRAASVDDLPELEPHAAPPARAFSDDHPPDTMAEASVAEKHWKAKLAELKFKQEAGELVPASEVAGEITSAFTEVKTKLLGVPSRARQQDPAFTTEQIALLESLIREALEALAARSQP